MATKEQIKRIYGLGAGLGIVGKDKDDMLHELIFSITGKDSVKQLDDSEFKVVQAELINRMKLADPNHLLHNTKSRNKKKEAEEIGCNGMATPEQQRLCWRYCYRLKELDTNPESADVGDRLIGVIGKVLGVLSYNDDKYVRDLYKDYNIQAVTRNNSLSSGDFKEVIITNF